MQVARPGNQGKSGVALEQALWLTRGIQRVSGPLCSFIHALVHSFIHSLIHQVNFINILTNSYALCQAGFRGKSDTAQHSQSVQTSKEKDITFLENRNGSVAGGRPGRGEEGGVPKAKRDPLRERGREVDLEDVAVN